MGKIQLGDLISKGIIGVSQAVQIYIDSFSRECAYTGTASNVPDGYKNFIVNGLAAEGDTLKVRVKLF